MKEVEFSTNLRKNRAKLVLHGDAHQLRRDLIGYWHERKLHVLGSGSFGARPGDRPEATPCLYNVLAINRDLKSMRVHTRHQPTPTSSWEAWYQWPDPQDPKKHMVLRRKA